MSRRNFIEDVLPNRDKVFIVREWPQEICSKCQAPIRMLPDGSGKGLCECPIDIIAIPIGHYKLNMDLSTKVDDLIQK